MSVITQDGYTALMMAARWGWAEVVSLLLEAGANTDLQNKVKCQDVVLSSNPLLQSPAWKLVQVCNVTYTT